MYQKGIFFSLDISGEIPCLSPSLAMRSWTSSVMWEVLSSEDSDTTSTLLLVDRWRSAPSSNSRVGLLGGLMAVTGTRFNRV